MIDINTTGLTIIDVIAAVLLVAMIITAIAVRSTDRIKALHRQEVHGLISRITLLEDALREERNSNAIWND